MAKTMKKHNKELKKVIKKSKPKPRGKLITGKLKKTTGY